MKLTPNAKRTLGHIVLYAVFVLIAVIALFPILYVFLASFRTDEEIFKYAFPFTRDTIFPVRWTVENYITIFRDFGFGMAVMNTSIVVLVLIPVNLLVASLAGYAFAFYNFKGKNALFAIFMVSFMVPIDSVALPLYTMITKMGLVNTRWALILPSISNGLAMFLFTQFFRGIPVSLLEAARIDGANLREVFFRIVVPLSVPIFITAGLMIFVNEWNNYLWPLLVTRSQEMRTIQVSLAYFKDENETFWSLVYAAASISTIVPVLLFLPLQKYFVQGITAGGVKG
ncbi:MAG: carbohydrate ABC transporter permease [Clostridia bacterium]|nr:carbohydrate ABC transporter permease [Clostridia bacterium]